MSEKKSDEKKRIASNRKAGHEYHLTDKFEAGMVLQGTEVKSLREGGVNLVDSYVDVKNGEAMLWQLYDNIRARTLITRGAESDLLSVEAAQAMSCRGPKPEIVQFAGVGHAPTLVADGKIHVLGGRFDTPAENTAMHDVYDPKTNAWTSAPPLPRPRSGGSAVLYRGRILVTGGECDNDKPFVDNDAYDLKSQLPSIIKQMEANKQAIADDMKL